MKRSANSLLSRSLFLSVGLQGVFLVMACLAFDGGQLFVCVLLAMTLYWSWITWIMTRRGQILCKTDFLLIRYGFLGLVTIFIGLSAFY